MRNGSGFARGLRTRRGTSLQSVAGLGAAATVPGKSIANARHNGRKIRLACAEAANNSVISGVLNTLCNCKPKPTA
jgi:hypothetical protein